MNTHLSCNQPSAWVARFAPLVQSGEVLDLACGAGRHARHFARLGHSVIALDRDTESLSGLAEQKIMPMQFDLECDGMQWPFEPDRFAAIVVTNYLHRPLFPHIFASLAVDGFLIYETFAHGNEHFGKPSSPAFLLAPGELLDAVRVAMSQSLRVIAYEDGFVAEPKPIMVQRICVYKQGVNERAIQKLRLF